MAAGASFKKKPTLAANHERIAENEQSEIQFGNKLESCLCADLPAAAGREMCIRDSIDIVVGMQQLLAGDLIASVGNDLVGVHVGLGAAARLPDDEGEMLCLLYTSSTGCILCTWWG